MTEADAGASRGNISPAMPVCVATPHSMLCKPHSFKTKVQWTAHNIDDNNSINIDRKCRGRRRQCAWHRCSEARGVRVEHIHPPENPCCGRDGQNQLYLIVAYGNRGENGRCLKKKKFKKGKKRWEAGGVTSILRPSTNVP